MDKFNIKEYSSLKNKDKETYKEENESFYVDRVIDIAELLDLKVSVITEKSKPIDDEDGFQIGQKVFGVVDELKDLNSYIKLIKKSEKYKKYLKKNKKNK